MREVPLTIIKGGINRQRIKGGARADTLYDFVNGYATDANTGHAREGSRRIAELDSSTKGICAFDGSLHTFAPQIVTVPPGFTLHVISHPDSTTASVIAITKIHFAAPFLGFLYVVAEFTGGDVFHYWLRTSGPWTANTVYFNGDVVEPTVANGLAYRATRISSPFQSWAPSVPRANGDIVEPTVYNDFFYTVVDTIGASPRSGTTEPDWPESDGAQVVEDVNGTLTTSATSTPPSGDTSNPSSVDERYS